MKITNYYSSKTICFDDIRCGEVFVDDNNPNIYLLKTDYSTEWPAVNLESGVLLPADEFDLEDAHYHLIDAELIIRR